MGFCMSVWLSTPTERRSRHAIRLVDKDWAILCKGLSTDCLGCREEAACLD